MIVESAQQTQQIKESIFQGNTEIVELKEQYRVILNKWLAENNQTLDPALTRLARTIRAGLREDYDIVIAVTGREGSGKSTLQTLISMLVFHDFKYTKHASFLPDTGEIKMKFKKTPRFGILDVDEAIDILYKHDWHKELQQSLVKMYAKERWHNKATILAMPRFKDFTEGFRNHRINLWIHIETRGLAFIYVPVDVPFLTDPWMMDENTKKYQWILKMKKGAEITVDDKLRIEKKNPCFLDSFTFPDLPPVLRELYLKCKNAARLQGEGDEDLNTPASKDKIRRSLAIQVLKSKERGMRIKDVATEYALTENMVKTLAKEGRTALKNKAFEENKQREAEWVN